MGIFNTRKMRVEAANTKADLVRSNDKNDKLVLHIDTLRATLQAATDPLTNTDTTSNEHYVGNPYKTYSAQVKALNNKYNLAADWGCLIAKNIIDVRAAFMIGRGVQVVKRDGYDGDATRELDFIRSFINFNNIDEESPQDWAIGSEIEGKVLLRLLPMRLQAGHPLWPRYTGMIRSVYTPWKKFDYTITADEPDFYHYIKADYEGTGTRPDSVEYDPSFHIQELDFVYRRFGGTSDMVNETPPKTAFVLRHMEDVDKELWDWRKINHLFAAPTPVLRVEDPSYAEQMQEWIKNKDWRIGKALVIAGGTFELVSYTGEGYQTIQKAAEADIQVISGATGVPVHFLGHPELLSNRATAENLLELIELSTGKERKIWVGAYEELFQKAILMQNEAFRTNLNPMAVDAAIPFTSSQSLKIIGEVYLPMYLEGAMSLPTLLGYLSELDTEKEIERIKEDKKNELSANSSVAGALPGRDTRNGGRDVVGRSQSNRR